MHEDLGNEFKSELGILDLNRQQIVQRPLRFIKFGPMFLKLYFFSLIRFPKTFQFSLFPSMQMFHHHSIRLFLYTQLLNRDMYFQVYSFIHSFIYLSFQFIHSFIHLFIHRFIYLFKDSFIYSQIHLFVLGFIYLFIDSFIYSWIHLFIQLI